jgi:non-specific serine/threonine protein kinase
MIGGQGARRPLGGEYAVQSVPSRRPGSEPNTVSAVEGSEIGRGALPTALTPFVGREREVVAACALLLRPDVRLVTLTGPGGVGKTRLALQVAAELGRTFDGVAFVSLAPIRDPRLVLPTVAQVLGVREAGDWSVVEVLADALGERLLLLVLDNLEQVPAAPHIAELLVACPSVKVLATSREVLRVSGECDFPVPPLALPDGPPVTTAAALGAFEAVRLFVARAQAVNPDFALDEDNAPVVAEACRRLDGLPLAIELAAARLRHLPLKALLARLQKRLPLLTGGARDQPARLRTMRDAIAWSYELLDDVERALLRRLAVFVGGVTLDAAEAVGGEGGKNERPPSVLEGVASLVDKSLLRPEAGAGGEARYRMLETIREYGLERLEARGEVEPARRAHAAYFLAFAEHAARGVLTAAEQSAWLDRLERDHDNLRSSLAWFLDADDAEAALRLAGALSFFWYYRGHLAEGRRALESALAAGAPDARVAPAVRAWALTGSGLLANVQGDLVAATTRLTEGIELWGASGEAWGAAVARGLLGGVLVGQGRYDEAAVLFEEGLARFEDLGDEAWISHARFHLGAIAFARGDRETARVQCREAADRYDAIGTRFDAIDPLRYLGLLACAEGDLAQAAALFADNLARLQARGSPSAIATGLADVATLAARRGAFLPAAQLFGAADALHRAERATLSLPARDTYEAAMVQARTSLGEQSYEIEHAAGHALTLEQAAVVAAEVLGTAPQSGSQQAARPAGAAAPGTGLTERELDVLRLLAAGKTNPEIAGALFIGRGTARNHVSHILTKLGAKTRTEGADLARRQGLI